MPDDLYDAPLMDVHDAPSPTLVQGDASLAKLFIQMGKHGQPSPSTIQDTDWLATAQNRERLGNARIVDLSCRHKAVTSNRRSLICPRCTLLMQQGMDYDRWIRIADQSYDDLVWREDPCRWWHERHTSEGPQGGPYHIVYPDDRYEDHEYEMMMPVWARKYRGS